MHESARGRSGRPQLSTQRAELFYAVRCSLLYAFGVPDADALKRLGMTGVAIADRTEGKLGDMNGLVVVESNGDTAVLFIDAVLGRGSSGCSIGKAR